MTLIIVYKIVKLNDLIECLTAILECIDLILVGRACINHPQNYITPTYCELHKMNMWGIPSNPRPILLH